MACNAANRDMVYYTFGDEDLRDRIYYMYLFLTTNQITIGKKKSIKTFNQIKYM